MISSCQTSCGTFERSLPADVAICASADAAREHGIHLSVRQIGDTVKTSLCDLTDGTGRKASGLGKGIGDQSVASAIFEAFEHYFSFGSENESVPTVEHLDLSGLDFELRDGSPDFRSICGNHAMPLVRLAFNSTDGARDSLRFPAFLINPDYDPISPLEAEFIRSFGLMRYSTNSGTAAGLSLDDAMLHGLLEVVERDAIGIELLRVVIRRDAHPVREVQRHTLPPNIIALFDIIEQETGGLLCVWDITTDLRVPVILAGLTVNGVTTRRYFGSGASLSPSYAIERAILETVQSLHARSLRDLSHPKGGNEPLDDMPTYMRCFLDAGFFGYRGGAAAVRFADIKSSIVDCDKMTSSDQFEHIADCLRERGLNSYWRIVASGSIHVTQVVVPKLERFHLVTHGTPVAPSWRGKGVLTGAVT